MTYAAQSAEFADLIREGGASWASIDSDAAARFALQNRFQTGIDIARYRRRDHARRHGRL